MSTPSADRTAGNVATATPSKTTARRALSELTPNAIVSPSKSTAAAKQHALSPLKQSHTVSSLGDENAQSHHAPPAQISGRKRSIHEIDNSSVPESKEEAPNKRLEVHAEPLAETRPHKIATLHQTPASNTRQLIDLCNEDYSSTDDDQDHPPRVSQNTIGSKASFSSLIDYNPSSSQPVSSSPPVPAATVSAKTQAETLRLRLRVALYKVKTDQTSVPLSRLEIPAQYQKKRASSSDATISPNPASAASTRSPHDIPTIQVSPSKPASERVGSAPKLLPAPVLLPTAYSSRMVAAPSLPSSPPESTGADEGTTPKQAEDFETPVNRREAAQLSSPPGSEEQERTRRQDEHSGDSDDLTSSVVKGRAASGLLELMRSA